MVNKPLLFLWGTLGGDQPQWRARSHLCGQPAEFEQKRRQVSLSLFDPHEVLVGEMFWLSKGPNPSPPGNKALLKGS